MKFILVIAILGAVGWYYLKPLPPGKGPEAAKVMRVGNGVVGAIESYRQARSLYPATLEDMVPEFIGGVPHLSNGSSIDYVRNGSTFTLTVNYANPIPVHCSITPLKKWDCEWF
jgi:hypothetical protein